MKFLNCSYNYIKNNIIISNIAFITVYLTTFDTRKYYRDGQWRIIRGKVRALLRTYTEHRPARLVSFSFLVLLECFFVIYTPPFCHLMFYVYPVQHWIGINRWISLRIPSRHIAKNEISELYMNARYIPTWLIFFYYITESNEKFILSKLIRW